MQQTDMDQEQGGGGGPAGNFFPSGHSRKIIEPGDTLLDSVARTKIPKAQAAAVASKLADALDDFDTEESRATARNQVLAVSTTWRAIDGFAINLFAEVEKAPRFRPPQNQGNKPWYRKIF